MAWSAVASAVTRIGDLLIQEGIYLWGMEEQVERLQTELKWMQSFLIEADAKQAEDERISLWVGEIRDLAYDAEDVVETFALKIGSKKKGGFSNCIKRSACIMKEGRMLYTTRSKIDKIIARITDLTRRLRAYGIKELRVGEGSSSANERHELRRSYPHIMGDNIVGLDADIKKLVSVLVDEESDCRVVSICGMGGLGKTTLAKKVYHHYQVKDDQFNHLAWVYVSQHCQRRKVWEDILSGLISSNERGSKLSDEELAEKSFNVLKDKKCLVIIDDIWSTEAWDSIKAGFPTRETSSKILLTSRSKEVALHADARGYLHELQCLKYEESRELFQKIAFPGRDSQDYRIDVRMEELGKDMVKHCAGLPLAITVLGGILASRNSLSQWHMVSENVKSYLKRGKGQELEHVLELSYDDLPSYLKPCFLYLGHFPENYEIHADRLIQLWVAEGIVSSKQEEGDGEEIIEDVAECYLMELAKRCMIQVRQSDAATLKIKTFHMHDLMRDLCLSKAKQENFLFIVDQSNAHSLFKIRKARRVSAHQFLQMQSIKTPNLRSLLFFDDFFPDELFRQLVPLKMLDYFESHEDEHFNPLFYIVALSLGMKLHKNRRIWRYMFNNFKLLRVLDSETNIGYAGYKLPSDIGKLIHLRFLSLRYLGFLRSKLPSSLGNLRCLQTLDLRVAKKVHVPDVLWRIEQLRHLYLPKECNPKTKLKLGTLRKMQTLVNFNTKSCYVEDLINMTNIRELKIYGPFNIEDFNEDLDKNFSIVESKYLHSLYFDSLEEAIDPRHLIHLLSSSVSICRLSLKVKISKLPEYHYLSSNISYIHIGWCKLEEDPMPTLEKLPNLRILELEDKAFIGKELVCSAEGFPNLDCLSFNRLFTLEEWKVDEGAMPALRHLEIVGCYSLKMLPDGLRFLTSLQELKIESMYKTFKDKVVEGGEDFYKVQHVPSITFRNCDYLLL